MTTTKLRLTATGIAALLGLGMAAAPSEAATPAPASPGTEAGELVPFHAGHDHSGGDAKDDKGKDGKKGKKSGKKDKGAKKGKGKGKKAHDHGSHDH